MNIQTDINWIHQEIDKVKDPNFLNKLKNLLQFKSNYEVESSYNYNLEIENALESLKNGNFYTENEAKLISKKWGRK